MSSSAASPRGPTSALTATLDPSSPSVFLQTTDDSAMFRYVSGRAWQGLALGTALSAAAQLLAHRYSPAFRRYTNVSARATLLFAGAGSGFTIASERALLHYSRYLDRPDISGHARLSEQDHQRLLQMSRSSYVDQWKDWAWNYRFRFIFAAWGTTMAAVVYKDYANPLLNSVHKFGHARLWSQGVTIVAAIAAFYFNDESGPHAAKYHDRDAREKELE